MAANLTEGPLSVLDVTGHEQLLGRIFQLAEPHIAKFHFTESLIVSHFCGNMNLRPEMHRFALNFLEWIRRNLLGKFHSFEVFGTIALALRSSTRK